MSLYPNFVVITLLHIREVIIFYAFFLSGLKNEAKFCISFNTEKIIKLRLEETIVAQIK